MSSKEIYGFLLVVSICLFIEVSHGADSVFERRLDQDPEPTAEQQEEEITCPGEKFWNDLEHWDLSTYLKPRVTTTAGDDKIEMITIIELHLSEAMTDDAIDWNIFLKPEKETGNQVAQAFGGSDALWKLEIEGEDLKVSSFTKRFVEQESSTYHDYPFSFEIRFNCADSYSLEFELSLRYAMDVETLPMSATIRSATKATQDVERINNDRHGAALKFTDSISGAFKVDEEISLEFKPESTSVKNLNLSHLYQMTSPNNPEDLLKNEKTTHSISEGVHQIKFRIQEDGYFLLFAVGESQNGQSGNSRRLDGTSAGVPRTAAIIVQVGDPHRSKDNENDDSDHSKQYAIAVYVLAALVIISVLAYYGYKNYTPKDKSHFRHQDSVSSHGTLEFVDRKNVENSSGSHPRTSKIQMGRRTV